jgi:glucokinase
MKDKIIAIDLGGTNLRVSLVKGKRVLKYIKSPTPKTKDKLLKLMVSMISQLLTKDVRAIGVASPGPLKDGIIKNPPNLPLRNFDLRKFLRKKFKRMVVIGNDADAVAMSEAKFGVKKKNFIILTLGTGIGGGVIINGKLFKGEGYAGELGNIIIDNGKTMEELWQKNRKDCKVCFGKQLKIKDLLAKKDKKAKKLLNEASIYLGQGIASLVNVFDPEVIVLMGGARETGNKFLKMIEKQANEYTLLPKKVKIQWSKIPHPGVLGASLLVSKK